MVAATKEELAEEQKGEKKGQKVCAEQ